MEVHGRLSELEHDESVNSRPDEVHQNAVFANPCYNVEATLWPIIATSDPWCSSRKAAVCDKQAIAAAKFKAADPEPQGQYEYEVLKKFCMKSN